MHALADGKRERGLRHGSQRLFTAKKQERLSDILNLVGLTDTATLYPNQVSASMEQRIAVARAFAVDPDLLLMDEPYGQLDAQTRYFMEKETVRIWETEKRTVLFVTNNIDEAIFLGDRIVSLRGKLPGRMHEIYDVHLPRPREHTDMEFLELRHRITEDSELVL